MISRHSLDVAPLQVFDPLLRWASQHLGWSMTTSDALTGAPQSAECDTQVREMLQGATILVAMLLSCSPVHMPGLLYGHHETT